MRILKGKWFMRFAQRENIGDEILKGLVNQLNDGRVDADLGGGVYKQRLARKEAGKSRGYRIIMFFKQGRLAFFIYGYAKSERVNITPSELSDFKKLAKTMLLMTDKEMDSVIGAGGYQEIL